MHLLEDLGPAHVVALCQPPTMCKPVSGTTASSKAAAGAGTPTSGTDARFLFLVR